MGILVLGTVALDTVKTPFGKKDFMLGGSAVHFSIASTLFTEVSLVAVVGEDFPAKHIEFLLDKGIDLTSLIHCPGKSFKWQGEYSGDLNCALTLNTELGVLSSFNPSVAAKQRDIQYIFLANVDPDVQARLLSHMRRPRLIGLDSMNFWIKHKRPSLVRLLKKVDIFVANDQEARDLSGEINLVKAAKKLSRMGPRMVLIKKGEHGVLFYSKAFTITLPAYPTEKVIDPTGAGDTFAGAFMGYLAKSGKLDIATIKKSLAYGTVAASFNIEDFGTAKTSCLTLADLNKRLKELKKIVTF